MGDRLAEYRAIGLRALSYHDYTPKGIYKKMLEKGGSPEDREAAREAVLWLHDEGYINERKFGEKLLADCERSFYGPRRVAEELKKRDFSEKFIARALSDEVDYYSRAVSFLRSQREVAARLADPREYDRLVRLMMRNGYTYDMIKDAVEAVR